MNIPRSILKNPSVPSTDPPLKQQDRMRETALYHANLIQHRKDVENQILNIIEALLELPSSSDADPASPSVEEAAVVGSSLRLFQPSDYDALVEERNINKQCGYVLCPRLNRQQETTAKYRLIKAQRSRRSELHIVKTHAMEKWCSDECGRRALYLKAQLNGEPAWTRDASEGSDIAVFEQHECRRHSQRLAPTMLEDVTKLRVREDEEQVDAKMKALAIERGDAKMPSKSSGLVQVVDKDPSRRESLDYQLPAQDTSDAIEGYQPRFEHRKLGKISLEVESSDLMSTI
ncbi:uncharacterized protein KY384_003189 [Bacidia gigantensis]|uniref:uncharacterized protein n=1 Tax=Bacidia gigantensis TaxID=2732470 RepID=UPI001D03D46F|nr:uncharacterized protein KY384_003189 [Bacidia gigantensis]KAG8531559.1 hypothetical protein KY384_003189 [Bacidia gigantensis]